MDTKHFWKYQFWFSCSVFFIGVVYLFLITFIHIDEKNLRFADTSQGFFIGSGMVSAINFVIGAAMKMASKNDVSSNGTTTTEVTTTVQTNPGEDESSTNRNR